MLRHERDSANPHRPSQVPSGRLTPPNDSGLAALMEHDFRRAFLCHLEEHQTPLATLARDTGVSLDVLKKLKTRSMGSTSAENAILIAAFYGKTVNQFVANQSVTVQDKAANLLGLMTPSEQQLFQAQMLGVIAARARQ